MVSPLKRAKGSGREVINPLAGIMSQTEKLISFADRIRIGRLIAETAEKYPNLGSWVEEVKLPAHGTKLNLDQAKANFEKAGIDLSNLESGQLDKLFTTWSQFNHGIPSDNILTFYKDGKLKAYQLNKDLYEGVRGIQPMALQGFWKFLTYPKRLVTAGATGYRPSFALLTNLLRDPWTASMQSQLWSTTPLHGLYGTIKMAAHKLGLDRKIIPKGSEKLAQYIRLGGEHATFYNTELPKAMATAREIIADNKRSEAMNVLYHPIDLFREIMNTPEMGPRGQEFGGVYDKVLKETGSHRSAWIESLSASKESTMNFGRMGRSAGYANQFIPFFNPAIQEPGLILRTFRDRPVQTMAKGVAYLSVPTILLWDHNKDKDWYKALPTWEKATFWHFEVGDKVVRLPKPFLWGAIFASAPETILDSYYKRDPQLAMDMVKQIGSNTIPPLLPAAVGPMFSVNVGEGGYDFFRNRPIVAESMISKFPPEERANKFTTETAKFIGKMLNVSPLKVDYLISGQTGGMGLDAVQAIEKAVYGKSGRKQGIEYTPVIGRLFSKNNYVGHLYDILDDLNNDVQRIKMKPKTEWSTEESRMIEINSQLDSVARGLSKVRKDIRAIEAAKSLTEDEKKRRVKLLEDSMEKIAHDAVFGNKSGKKP